MSFNDFLRPGSFNHQRAVVTGGASGIGFEVVLGLLRGGAEVIVWDWSEAAISEARSQLVEWSNQVHFERVDVSSGASVESASHRLPGPIDILVNNAGITRDKTLAKMSLEDFQSVIQVNLQGVFLVTQTLLSRFKEVSAVGIHSNRIVNLASVVALYGNFGQTNYAASKAGVVAMTQTWARELARRGFTVNAVAPGFTETAMTRAMPETAKEAIAMKIPLGRMAKPSEIAAGILFLCSGAASYVTGTVLSVDGGCIPA